MSAADLPKKSLCAHSRRGRPRNPPKHSVLESLLADFFAARPRDSSSRNRRSPPILCKALAPRGSGPCTASGGQGRDAQTAVTLGEWSASLPVAGAGGYGFVDNWYAITSFPAGMTSRPSPAARPVDMETVPDELVSMPAPTCCVQTWAPVPASRA